MVAKVNTNQLVVRVYFKENLSLEIISSHKADKRVMDSILSSRDRRKATFRYQVQVSLGKVIDSCSNRINCIMGQGLLYPAQKVIIFEYFLHFVYCIRLIYLLRDVFCLTKRDKAYTSTMCSLYLLNWIRSKDSFGFIHLYSINYNNYNKLQSSIIKLY